MSSISGNGSGGSGVGLIKFLQGDSGGPVGPNPANIIFTVGGNNITVAGNAATFTETISVTGTTNHSVLLGNATGSISSLANGTTGQVLHSITGANDPQWSAVSLTADVTGVLPIANGGTNASSMTNTYGVNYFDGTRIVTTAVGTATHVLTSNGAGVAPSFQAVSAGGVTVTTFNYTGGAQTWNKGASTKFVKVYGWNGGSGGGGGAGAGLGDNAGGGSGGSAGGCFYYEAPATYFPASVTVTIGAGGAGGAGGTGGSGSAGSKGGQTSFGDIVVPLPGTASNGGTLLAGGAGVNSGDVWFLQGYAAYTALGTSGAGAATGAAAGSAATVQGGTSNVFMTPTAGGGGGGFTSAGNVRSDGGKGGDFSNIISSATIIAGGAGGTPGAGIPGSPGNNATTSAGLITGGTGGGGGSAGGGGTGGDGGAGGVPGAGGGGGGAAGTFGTGGTGGAGGAGRVIVIEFA